jgi:ATP-dependent helicase HrpA
MLETLPSDTRIAITQPRRLAVRSVSSHVARLHGSPLGKEIGYQVRHDSVKNDETRVIFMTDGIILAEFQSDPLLTKYDVIVVDEAHERSLNIDFTLGLARNAQTERKKARFKTATACCDVSYFGKRKISKFF